MSGEEVKTHESESVDLSGMDTGAQNAHMEATMDGAIASINKIREEGKAGKHVSMFCVAVSANDDGTLCLEHHAGGEMVHLANVFARLMVSNPNFVSALAMASHICNSMQGEE